MLSTRLTLVVLALLLAPLAAPSVARADRLLELCEIEGQRPNQLVGYGLVVGLAGTGDSAQARFTPQMAAAMLRRLGQTVDPVLVQMRNTAAVMVTATLPANANPGTRIDINVSSLGNARSLSGGVLLQTPLQGADRNVYAVAQGPVLLGGFGAEGGNGSVVRVNHLTAGRIPSGAIVEQRVPGSGLSSEGPIVLSLRQPSFITARRIATAINEGLGTGTSSAVDSGTVRVRVPSLYREDRVGLLAYLQQLDVIPATRARVVIDERTGTIVLGADVRIRQAAIAQGGITVAISEQQAVSQPNALADGETTVTQNSQVTVQAEAGAIQQVGPTATLQDVVNALNALGVRPRDLVAIFQGLQMAGALSAEVEVQ